MLVTVRTVFRTQNRLRHLFLGV